ncbi:hypothetical protein [Bacillus thuringiensis]|uniref:hypothetical protein n=1 Tax=Bacillus cereus group TaxID=86661 RepID=UPI000BF2B01D|nr:hypothetical protein [Bacillus thuringiensis]PEV64243.1 hypothetical protein CN434_25955 [Bacillus thuringiensis]
MIDVKDPVFISYCESLIDKTYKILPLYEEKNVGLASNIESLVIEVFGLHRVIDKLRMSAEYVTLVSTLKALEIYIKEDVISHREIKREVFKCIGLIKKIREVAMQSGE